MTLFQSAKILYVKLILSYRYFIIQMVQKYIFEKNQSPKKILLHRIGTFGDSIVALPAVGIISDYYKDAIIDFVSTGATPLNLSVLIEDDFFNSVILIESTKRKNELQKLKFEKYDLYIEIPQNYGLIKTIRNMFIARFILGIKSGFGWDEGMVKTFAKEQLMFYPPLRETDRFIRNLKRFGIEGKARYPLKIDDPTTNYIECFEKRKIIAFVIGSNVPANMWPVESWKELAFLMHEKGFAIAVIGGKQELEKGEQIISGLNYAKNYCGQFSIAESAGFLRLCSWAVCHDTGAMHLCYAVKTPLVALFSPRQLSSKWFPPLERNIVMIKYTECAGCFKKQCEDNICMKQIDPTLVENQLLEVIGGIK